MAKRTITTLIDDIDGSEAVETVSFAFRGTSYSIDLNQKNADAFEKAMAKFVEHANREPATRSARSRAEKSSASVVGKRTDLAAVRAWADTNGWEVSSRGRVAAEVLEAYDAAR